MIDDLGRGVNPRFLAAARKADQQNMNLMRDQHEYWERRSKLDPFTHSRTARERLSHTDAPDEEDDAPAGNAASRD